jgi:tRNA pseudouridine38-40 synthase
VARYQIIIAYDGTRFAGSQRQAKAPTIQGELEGALTRLGWKGKGLMLAGRTDSGVHAAGQVGAVDLDWRHTPDELGRALNAALPADISVQRVRLAPAGFHPRFDASSRRYRYRLYCHQVRDPLRERYAWRVIPAPDGETLATTAGMLMGRHDFAAFGSPPGKSANTVRTVSDALWMKEGDEWQFEVQADAFLYRMVRRMVFVQVAAAQGRLSPRLIQAALAEKQRLPAGLAPACGLTLMSVSYPGLDDQE